MLLNEPIAKLRTLSATLLAADGETLLSLATVWLTGMVKVSRNGSAFVDAVNLPVAVTGGGDGAFDIEIALAEIATPGTIRVRFFDAVGGNLIAEYTDEVEATADDYIRRNESNASERVLDATIYDESGDLLAADTAWSAGMVKVSKAGGAFANAAALPVAVASGSDGAFRLQFSQAETDTVGNLRVRFYTSGGTLIGEFVAQVRTVHALSGEASAHEAILRHWHEGWAGAQPSIPWTPTNEIMEAEDEWVRIMIAPALSRQTAIGTLKRWTRSGVIGVQIFSPANAGTLRVSQLADDIRTVLEGQFISVTGTDQPVVTLGGSSGTPVSDGKWLMQLVTFPYSWDELRA